MLAFRGWCFSNLNSCGSSVTGEKNIVDDSMMKESRVWAFPAFSFWPCPNIALISNFRHSHVPLFGCSLANCPCISFNQIALWTLITLVIMASSWEHYSLCPMYLFLKLIYFPNIPILMKHLQSKTTTMFYSFHGCFLPFWVFLYFFHFYSRDMGILQENSTGVEDQTISQ